MSETDALIIQCVYTGSDLQSHFAELQLVYRREKPDSPTLWTELFPISQWKSARLEPGLRGWHTNPNPALSILLQGDVETFVGGETRPRRAGAGAMSLSLDSKGQGHRTLVHGPNAAYAMAMLLTPDQFEYMRSRLTGWPADMLPPF